jgi:hypothetical protein
MQTRVFLGALVVCLGLATSPSFAQSVASPEGGLTAIVRVFLAPNYDTDWSGLEKLPGIKWAPLPPKMLDNCLPDGGCFTRQGTANLGGKAISVMATGARTIVTHVYLRNPGVAIGEAQVVAALKQAGFSQELARCPMPGTIGGTNWYRLKAAGSGPGFIAIQTSCNGKPCEGFTLTMGTDLPPLQPNQLRLYSEQCSAGTSERKAVSTSSPQEGVAQAIVAYVPQTSGPAFYDWKTLGSLFSQAEWISGGPKKFDPEPYPYTQSGNMKLAQREFSLVATGTQSQVKVIGIHENGMHPKGEDVLGLLRGQGFEVKLARCGPIYTESTNNWYAVTSSKTRPAMLQQSIRSEGKQAQDAYELRLDNTLPKRDPRDREPGVNGCR